MFILNCRLLEQNQQHNMTKIHTQISQYIMSNRTLKMDCITLRNKQNSNYEFLYKINMIFCYFYINYNHFVVVNY